MELILSAINLFPTYILSLSYYNTKSDKYFEMYKVYNLLFYSNLTFMIDSIYRLYFKIYL